MESFGAGYAVCNILLDLYIVFSAGTRYGVLGICVNEIRTPIHMYRMWRPAGGSWVEGETQLPWEDS